MVQVKLATALGLHRTKALRSRPIFAQGGELDLGIDWLINANDTLVFTQFSSHNENHTVHRASTTWEKQDGDCANLLVITAPRACMDSLANRVRHIRPIGPLSGAPA